MLHALAKLVVRLVIVAAHVATAVLIYGVIRQLAIGEPLALAVVFALVLMEGWLIYAYIRYRSGRQEEVQQLLRAAVTSEVPIEPALRTYLDERPSRITSSALQAIFALLLTPIVPFAIFLWLWLYYRRFDRRADQFAQSLYEGIPLDEAVTLYPAVLNSDARLAVRIGVATGKLELALNRAQPDRSPAAWLEVLPKLIYPLVVLYIICGIVGFLSLTVVPKFKKIHNEFNIALPALTQTTLEHSDSIEFILGVIVLLFILLSGTILLATISSRFCWYFPLFGRYYRHEMQGRVLRALSLLLESEMPAPEALRFLADSDELPRVVRRKLSRASVEISTGDLLPTVLARNQLLSRSMQPLLESAQAGNTLAWSLQELGDYLSKRALAAVQRWASIFSPLMLMILGVVVALAGLNVFLPFIKIMEALSQ